MTQLHLNLLSKGAQQVSRGSAKGVGYCQKKVIVGGVVAPIVAVLFGLCLSSVVLAEPKAAAWEIAAIIAANYAAGNTNSTNANIRLDATKEDENSKFFNRLLYNYKKDNGKTNSNERSFTSQYDRNLTPFYFAFGRYVTDADKPKNNRSRNAVSLGLGAHLVDKKDIALDVSSGFGLSKNRYEEKIMVDDYFTDRLTSATYNLNQNLTYKINSRFALKESANLVYEIKRQAWRTDIWLDLSYALNKTLSLNLGLDHQFNSKAAKDKKKADTGVSFGLAYRFN